MDDSSSDQQNGHDGAKTIFHKMHNVFKARNVANCAQHLVPYLKPGIKLLDVGCGPGFITIDMAQNYVTSGTVVGLDRNSESVATARRLAEDVLGSGNHTEWVTGDATDLSRFEDDFFDVVHAHQVLDYVGNPAAAMLEMRRVCKPGGIVSTRDITERVIYPEPPALQRFREIQDQIIILQGGVSLEAGRQNHVWARDAGFSIEDMEILNLAWGVAKMAQKQSFFHGVSDSVRIPALSLGLSTEEEFEMMRKVWEEWVSDPTSRFMALDSAVICRK